MLKLWREGVCPIVMQDHDALTFMYREEDEDRIIPYLLSALVVPIPLANNRVLRIPYDAEVGWNKGHFCCGEKTNGICNKSGKECDRQVNLDGLDSWKGHDSRKRQPIIGLLDAIVTKKFAKAG
jgi:hypothetical protein